LFLSCLALLNAILTHVVKYTNYFLFNCNWIFNLY